MKRLFAILAGLCLVSAAYAVPDATPLTIQNASTGAVAASTSTSVPLRGYLEGINIFVLSSATTGNVSLVITTNSVYPSEVILYTNSALVAHTPVRPRFAQHDTAGNTNSILEKLFLFDAQIQFRVGGLVYTNKDLKAVILFNNDRER